MNTKEIQSYYLYNNFNLLSNEKLNTLDEVLEHFKNKCLICIDRGWLCWNNILSYIEKHKIKDQIILKSPVCKQFIKSLTEVSIKYMPIIYIIEMILIQFYKVIYI